MKSDTLRNFEIILKKYKSDLKSSFESNGIDISPEQWSILRSVGYNEGISQKEVADISLKEPAAITRMLDALSDNNLVARIARKEDRRKFQLILSTKGRELFRQADKLSKAVEKKLFSHLSEGEQQELKTLILIIISKL